MYNERNKCIVIKFQKLDIEYKIVVETISITVGNFINFMNGTHELTVEVITDIKEEDL